MHNRIKEIFAIPLVALILSCGACSTTDKQQVAANPVNADGLPILTEEQKEAGIICVRETVVGSRLSKKKCSTKEQRERDQRLAQEQLHDSTRRSAGPTNSGQ